MTAFDLQQIKDAGWLNEANYIDGHWVAADDSSYFGVNDPSTETQIGRIPWRGAVETRRAIDADQAAFACWSLVEAGLADLVAFSRPFIGDPGFPRRIANSWSFNALNAAGLYGGDEQGFTDYPQYAPYTSNVKQEVLS